MMPDTAITFSSPGNLKPTRLKAVMDCRPAEHRPEQWHIHGFFSLIYTAFVQEFPKLLVAGQDMLQQPGVQGFEQKLQVELGVGLEL